MTEDNGLGPSPLGANGICLLSLDGGGVRGLSSLLILRDVMMQLSAERESSELIKPCDVFDLIGGTSTGGLIAIMLGRLEMGVDECILAYTELMQSVFSEKISNLPIDWSGDIVSQYDSKKLRDAIENVITRAGMSPTDLMNDDKPRRSRVFVCTTSKETLQIARLRSYDVSNEDSLPVTVCEAALATSAATGFFDPITIGNQQFVDGAFGANNPIEEVEEEAADIWCSESRDLKPLVKCFVSVGTGNPAKVSVDNKMFKFLSKTLVRMATKPESTERRFMARWSNEVRSKRCFRFNVEQGLQEVHMTECCKRGLIESATGAYLHHSAQKSRIRDCVVNLSSKHKKANPDFELVLKEYADRLARHQLLQTIHSSKNPFLNSRPPCWEVPFERNPRYVDQKITGKLKRKLFLGHSNRIAIFGLGGVGKTQIALELAYQVRELHSDCLVFWIPAMDRESLQQAYQRMAERLGINVSSPNGSDVKSLVQHHLSQSTSGRWLLIFDNADDPDLWAENQDSPIEKPDWFFPSSEQGAIVLTTRSNRVARQLSSTEIFEIPEMDEARATDVLRNNLANKELLADSESICQLLSRLTYLPLAIVQAAAFINENQTTITSYVALLDGQEQDAIDLLSENFEDEGRYRSTRNPVATTWLTSFEQIWHRNTLAHEYLCFMGCMTGKDIPLHLLPSCSSVEQEKAIGVLASYSFVRIGGRDSLVNLHRLVHLAIRNWLRKQGLLAVWETATLGLLRERWPEYDLAHRSLERASLPHALHILNHASDKGPMWLRQSVLSLVGRGQIHDGRHHEGAKTFREALAIGELTPEFSKTVYIDILNGLAFSRASEGDLDEAEMLYMRAIELITKTYSSSHHKVMEMKIYMIALYPTQEGLQKSADLATKVIKCCLEDRGPKHQFTLAALGKLIEVYNCMGRLSDAKDLALQVLQILRSMYEPDHPAVAVAMINLADTYGQLWRLEEAETLYMDALDIQSGGSGPVVWDTLVTMQKLAVIWAHGGRRDQAIALIAECVRLFGQTCGSENTYTKAALKKLEEWSSSKNIESWLINHWAPFRRADLFRERRHMYPKFKVCGGLYRRSPQPKDDTLLRAVQKAVANISVDRQKSNDAVTLVDSQTTNKSVMTISERRAKILSFDRMVI